MTTIVCNREVMACDKQYTYQKTKFIGPPKVIEVPKATCKEVFGCNKALLGFAGNFDKWALVIQWLADPTEKPPKLTNDIELLLLTDDGKIHHSTDLKTWFKVDADYFSIGTGFHLALAAMESGKTPKEAIKIASKYDVSTGMGVKEYKL